jgi:hypothetical protein
MVKGVPTRQAPWRLENATSGDMASWGRWKKLLSQLAQSFHIGSLGYSIPRRFIL